VKCEESVVGNCEHCGSTTTAICGKDVAYVVFTGDPGDQPEGYCDEHSLNMGSGWIEGRIAWADVRQDGDGKWLVKFRGEWFYEASDKYWELRAELYEQK
jgi:hypothetical protein